MVLAHDNNEEEGTPKRTADIATDRDVTFESMLLGARTLAGLTKAGFVRPSPVQLQGIPSGKCGFNLLLEAKSGTGKTAVFAVIALELLELQDDAQTIILAPTREIAAQITDVIREIGCMFTDLRVEVVMGGLPIAEDMKKFANKRKVHIIVGSPGRLRHLIEKDNINTDSIRLFVLDEADKLMQGSFKADINYIFSSLPNCKQVIMSSATYPEDLKELVIKYMKNYIHVCPNSTSILLGIEQRVTVVKQHSNIIIQTKHRYNELLKIFKSRQFKQCLIFCNYQARVVEVSEKLKADKWPAQCLHGKQEQTDRLDALKTLQDYKCRILISTDLAARGIDASNVDLVINFEIPYDWPTYLHRIGRAGRYGSYGMAVSIVAEGKEEKFFKELISNIGAPVNIKTIWTEEPVMLEEMNGHIENKIQMNGSTLLKEKIEESVSVEGIWSFITDKELSKINESETVTIEDFNELNASYNGLNDIENFEQLMSSFENNIGGNIEVPYITVNTNFKTKRKSTEVHGDVIPELFPKKCLGDFKDSDGRIENESRNLFKNEPQTTTFTSDSKPQCSKSVNCLNKDEIEKNQNGPLQHNKNSNNVVLNEPVYYEHEGYNTEEDYVQGRCYSETNTNNHEVNSNGYSSSSESDYSETSSESCSEYDSDSSEENTTDINSDREILRMSETLSKQLYISAAARNYRIWKRQLEARTAQIQLMLYIQELGKMNLR